MLQIANSILKNYFLVNPFLLWGPCILYEKILKETMKYDQHYLMNIFTLTLLTLEITCFEWQFDIILSEKQKRS